ncbi:MAG: hypothetical protein ACJ8F7_17090 [Gemmataceae bacterium]
MESALSRLDGGEFVGLISTVITLLSLAIVLVTAIIAPKWRDVRRAEADAKLKHDLVAAGYSAEDIERVVQASPAPSPRRRPEPQFAYRR